MVKNLDRSKEEIIKIPINPEVNLYIHRTRDLNKIISGDVSFVSSMNVSKSNKVV